MKLIRGIIPAMFLLMLSFTGKAQEKYEYGQVAYGANSTLTRYLVTTSISGEFKTADNGTLAEGYVTNNALPVNKVLNELAEKGWEVYSTQTSGSNNTNTITFYFYIRKKKS